jgi:hypothetical protein
VGVVVGLLVVAQPAQGLDHGVLRFGLASINHVVNFGNIAEVRMFQRTDHGRNPAVAMVGVVMEFAISEIAAQHAELPHVVSDVFAHVADGAVGADDDFLIVLIVFGFLYVLRDLGGKRLSPITQQPLFLPSFSKKRTPLSLSLVKAASQKCR